jgi:hemolysin activation/secretion protein
LNEFNPRLDKFMPIYRYFPVVFATILMPIGSAHAQAIPDAGSIRQQIEKEREIVAPKPSTPTVTHAPPPMKHAGGVVMTVSSFRFVGNTLLSADQLRPVVAGYLNRPLDFAELQSAAAAVADAYRKSGWIVRAYLPQQEITDGVVTIQIVEAVFGAVRVEGNPPLRLKLDHVLSMVESAQAKGAPLNGDRLDRALLLINDQPGAAVAGNLAEGRQKNETDLILKFSDGPLMSGDAIADNTGSRSTGSERIVGNLYINSPLKLGDQVNTYLMHTQGTDYGRMDYTLPVGSDGWRVGFNASTLSYKLVAPEFSSLDAHGTSSTAGVEASYPLVRSRLQNIYLLFNYDKKRFDNESTGVTTTRYKIDTFSAGMSANLIDKFGGGGVNNGTLTLVQGQVDLTGSPNQAADAASTRTNGGFSKLQYAISRQQVISNTLAFYGSLAGQLANKNLDSAEKFYLGGATGVRAYPSSEGGGTEGQLLNLELRERLPQNFTLTGFYDWGHVTVNRDNDFTGAATHNNYQLQGAGISIGWLSSFGLNLHGTWAHRIGNNPNPTANGNDQDGSLLKNRFWLQAVQPF